MRHFSNEPKIALKISSKTHSEFGHVWKGNFNLNTLNLEVEIYKSKEKSFRIYKYPDTCERCLNKYYVFFISKKALYVNLHDQWD